MEEFESSVFYNCKKLTNITIPSTVKRSASNGIFGNCTALTEVVFADGMVNIPAYICSSAPALKKVTVENAALIETIGEYAFNNCKVLETIEPSAFPALKSIERNAFYNCEKLDGLAFEEMNALERIESYAFYNCKALTSVKFTEYAVLDSIASSAFAKCSALAEVELPYTVKKIESNAFAECSSLREVVFYHMLEELQYNSFAKCSSLENVYFNSTKTKIDTNAFEQAFSGMKVYGYEYSTAQNFAQTKGYAFTQVEAMNAEEDGYSIADAEKGFTSSYNVVRKVGSERNVAILDANGNVVAKGAWKQANSVNMKDVNGETVSVVRFEFDKNSGKVVRAFDAYGNEADIQYSQYKMVKAIPFEVRLPQSHWL